jgi:predicted RND superfamily exporter protein
MKINLEKINTWFEKRANGLIKNRWYFLGGFIIILLVSLYGTTLIKVDVSNESNFLPKDPIRQQTKEFEELFGNDQYVAVLVEHEELFSHRALTTLRELHNELYDSVPFVEKVTSLIDVEFTRGTEYGMYIEQIVPDIIPESREELEEIRRKAFSKKNFRERLISGDGTQTWIMMKLLPFPEDWEEEYDEYPQLMVGSAVDHILGKEKYSELNPRGTGMPYLAHEKREYFQQETGRIMGMALLMAIFVLAIALRSFKGVLIPLITAFSAIIIVNGLIGFSGIEVDNMVMVFPVLIGLAVALAYSIHIYSFFKRHFLKTGSRKGAVIHAIGEMGWPVFFTALTTVSALLSFLFIPIKTVRFIGLSTAAVVATTYFVIIILTPTLLSFGKDRDPHPIYEKNGGTFSERMLSRLGGWVLRHSRIIIPVYLVITAILIVGVTRVEADIDPRKNIGLKVPYVHELFEISQTELGALYSYDVVIDLGEPGRAKDPSVLRNLDLLGREIDSFPLTKRTHSVLEIIKDMNQVLNEDNPDYYAIPESREMTAQLFLLYENAGGSESEYWVDYDYQRLRIQVQMDNIKASEAKDEYTRIEEMASGLFPGAGISVVGTMPQFMKMIFYIIHGQIISFCIAFLVITAILMIVFGSVKTGLIGLIPNITPAIVIGGILGFSGIPLDTSTVIIMPMILGLAVDDTIHFINHGKLEFTRTGRYRSSITRTFGTVGVALFFTTIILSAVFLIYMTSEVKTYFNIGLLAISGMISALLADYLVTPGLFKLFRIFGHEKEVIEESKAPERIAV